jgi:membrane associated rhomboid family serine protease
MNGSSSLSQADSQRIEALNAAPDPVLPPWERPDAFPEKPVGHDYGYVLDRALIPCSRDELIRRCAGAEVPGIDLVWHPDAVRVVPAAQVPFLTESLRRRFRKQIKTQLWVGTVSLVYFAAVATTAWHRGQMFALLLVLMAVVGILPIVQGVRHLRDLRSIPLDASLEDDVHSRYRAWIGSRPIYFTWTLLALVYVIGAIELGRGIDISAHHAGLVKYAAQHGQWWRLFTAPFLHGSELHFALNALAMFGLGRLMEALASRHHLAITFIWSAVLGGLFSLMFAPASISVGASGGLMGLIGFLLVLSFRRRQHLPPGFINILVLNVMLVAFMGVVAFSIVDNAAHLGGLLGGMACGYLFVPRGDALPIQPKPRLVVVGWLSLITSVVATVWAAWKILA